PAKNWSVNAACPFSICCTRDTHTRNERANQCGCRTSSTPVTLIHRVCVTSLFVSLSFLIDHTPSGCSRKVASQSFTNFSTRKGKLQQPAKLRNGFFEG